MHAQTVGISGHEPTGLHAVFKRLWVDCDNKPDAKSVEAAIRKHKTVVWPTDAEVLQAIKTRPLYGSAITNFLLVQYDRSLKGDIPKSEPWIEHVLPEKPVDDWFKKFSKQEHAELKDLLANLIPLTSEMNSSIKNREYSFKQERYLKDSMFKSARVFAEHYADWTPDSLRARGEKLAEWSIKRWPH